MTPVLSRGYAASAMAARWRAAIVTGAASGIGRSFAQALARTSSALGLIDVSADGLQATGDMVRRAGLQLEPRICDVSAGTQVTETIQELTEVLQGVDLLVHCAAILGPGQFATQPAEVFERVIRVNLLGTVHVVRAALPALRRTRGAIACLVSTAAVHGWPGLGAYSAAKYGVAGFCDAIRCELERDGVTLTAVYPMLIDTPLLRAPDLPPILKQARPLPPETVVRKTLDGVARGRARVYIPESVRVLAALHGLMPTALDWYSRRLVPRGP